MGALENEKENIRLGCKSCNGGHKKHRRRKRMFTVSKCRHLIYGVRMGVLIFSRTVHDLLEIR